MFPYLDDVLEGDGGVFMLPGSHHSSFVRPLDLFGQYGQGDRAWHEAASEEERRGSRLPDELPVGCFKPVVRAGDFIVMPEATLHGVMPCVPRLAAAFGMIDIDRRHDLACLAGGEQRSGSGASYRCATASSTRTTLPSTPR